MSLFLALLVACSPNPPALGAGLAGARSPIEASAVKAEMQVMVEEDLFSSTFLVTALMEERLHPAGVYAIDQLLREQRSGTWRNGNDKRTLGAVLSYATIGSDPHLGDNLPARDPHPLIPQRGEPIDTWTIQRVLQDVGIYTLDPEVVLYAMHLSEVSRHNRELMMELQHEPTTWRAKPGFAMDAFSSDYVPAQENRVLSSTRLQYNGWSDGETRDRGHYAITNRVVADIEWDRLAPELDLEVFGLWSVVSFEEFQANPLRVAAPRLEFWANVVNPVYTDGATLRLVSDLLGAIEAGGGPLELRSRVRVLDANDWEIFQDWRSTTLTVDQVWQTAVTEMLAPGTQTFHTSDSGGAEVLYSIAAVSRLAQQVRSPGYEPDYRFYRADGASFYLRGRPQGLGSPVVDQAPLIGGQNYHKLQIRTSGHEALAPQQGTPWNDRVVRGSVLSGWSPPRIGGRMIDDRLWEDDDGVLWSLDGTRVTPLSHMRMDSNFWQLIHDERFFFFVNHTYSDDRADFMLDVEAGVYFDLPDLGLAKLRTWEVHHGILSGTRTPEGGNSWDPAQPIEPVDLYAWAELASPAPLDGWISAERWNGVGATPGFTTPLSR